MPDFHVTFRDILHAVNLRHGTNGFTSLPKEGVLRIFSSWKIRRLRRGLNPRTWVPKASTLPLDHRSRFMNDPYSRIYHEWMFVHSCYLHQQCGRELRNSNLSDIAFLYGGVDHIQPTTLFFLQFYNISDFLYGREFSWVILHIFFSECLVSGTFANFRQVTVCFVMSVCLSVCP